MLNKQEGTKGGITGALLGATFGVFIPEVGPIIGALIVGGLGFTAGTLGYFHNIPGIGTNKSEQAPQKPTLADKATTKTEDSYVRMISNDSFYNKIKTQIATWGLNKVMEYGEKSFTAEEKKALTQLSTEEKNEIHDLLNSLLAESESIDSSPGNLGSKLN